MFLGVYGSAVIKGAALLLAGILPVPVWALIWLVAIIVGLTIFIGGLRGVLYTEAMQGVVMLVGMLMLVGAIFSKVGGPWEGMQALAALPPSDLANNGFVSLSGGGRGLFILSLSRRDLHRGVGPAADDAAPFHRRSSPAQRKPRRSPCSS